MDSVDENKLVKDEMPIVSQSMDQVEEASTSSDMAKPSLVAGSQDAIVAGNFESNMFLNSIESESNCLFTLQKPPQMMH